ncbi:MAG TPA: 4-phosphoerythronate dehydrogenase [Kiritimatiellia bacterium]
MKIVCASSVLQGREAFSTLGEVAVVPERAITPETVRDADALITRSKVRVDASLLEGSRVAFVGTATAGTDHFALEYLAQRQIHWCAAPGCNANSVAEYVVAALLALAHRFDMRLAGRKLALVGAGHVGRRVAEICRAVGVSVLLNDPPLAAATGEAAYRPLDEILPQADIVSLHVPLTDDGPCPTRGLADARFFEKARPGCIFINASRGEVVDEAILGEAYDHGVVMHGVLDVWDHEPGINVDLLNRMDIGTPHVAGYSHEGKLNGTAQVYQEACRFFEVPAKWSPSAGDAPHDIRVDARELTDEEVLCEVVRHIYNIETDDFALRVGMRGPPESRSAHFERLRAQYPVRREFRNYSLRLDNASARLAIKAGALGFRVEGR